MSFNPKDHYYRKAKKENFAARSVFKLEEIDQRYHLFQGVKKVLDLGAAPGSWSQYASQRLAGHGQILGIDLTQITLKVPNAVFVQADLRDVNLENLMKDKGIAPPFDLVLSDMAPKTTGIRLTDQVRSFELCELALAQARQWLKPGGHFVCKLFHSDDFATLKKQMLETFTKFEAVKPDSTRKISKEIFLIGIKKK